MRDSNGAVGQLVARLVSVLRQVSGMPDYNGYAEHVRRYHPDTTVLSEREYYADYVHRRYGDGQTRCC
jgi:uncharacterized short protein YbdD (DUF466 family)